MNLGQAVAICLYELSRNEAEAQPSFPAARVASAEVYDRFTSILLQILSESGYVKELTSPSSQLKVRRLVRRLSLPAGDSETWLGILRQILWKVKRTS